MRCIEGHLINYLTALVVPVAVCLLAEVLFSSIDPSRGTLKTRDWKTRDWKTRDQNAGVENWKTRDHRTGLENAGLENVRPSCA